MRFREKEGGGAICLVASQLPGSGLDFGHIRSFSSDSHTFAQIMPRKGGTSKSSGETGESEYPAIAGLIA